MKIRARESIFIGDTIEADIWGAKQIGTIAVLIRDENQSEEWRKLLKELTPKPSRNTKPDYVIDDLMDIIGIIKHITKQKS